ncbi:hypothetical protein J3A83DRAFT_4422106 [Scleroderma citrinum]
MWPFTLSVVTLALSGLTFAHLAAWHEAMYCFNGTTPGQVNYNTNDAVNPMYMLSQSDYWFHHVNGCDDFPPSPGVFLELPAGGSFTVEIAGNRGVTSLSFNGQYATEWTDGQPHPGSTTTLTDASYSSEGCITTPNMRKFLFVAGLVTKLVPYSTPWQRVTSYDVPANMPACPSGGCTCAWVWIPDGCGEPNIYMEGFKCTVTNAKSTTPVGTPKAPVWCEDNQNNCVQGPKQIMIWNQQGGNNIEVSGFDLSGRNKSPAYNSKCGFQDGAQNDIFATSSSSGKRMVQKHKRSIMV